MKRQQRQPDHPPLPAGPPCCGPPLGNAPSRWAKGEVASLFRHGGSLPDALIAGAQRSGTTSLHAWLAGHREVFAPPRPQEIHFFDLERNYRRGPAWFARYFRARGPHHRVAFATSPLYLYHPEAPPRIAALLPAVRLVFTLRDPVARAYSHYWHSVATGWESLPFAAALDEEPARLRRGELARRHFSYLDRGRYATQLLRFRSFFAADQMLVLRFEDLTSHPAVARRALAAHLGLDAEGFAAPRAAPANATGRPRWPVLQRWTRPWRRRLGRLVWLVDRLNLRRDGYPPLCPELAHRLRSELAPEVERTMELTGLDLTGWLPGRQTV